MWRKDELERINSTTAGPERKAALCMLLEQEATLIASIGRHKVVADVENQDKQVKQFLEAVNTYTHTHTHAHVNIYMYMYMSLLFSALFCNICLIYMHLMDNCNHNNSSVHMYA